MTKRTTPHNIEKANAVLGLKLEAIREVNDQFRKDRERIKADRTLDAGYKTEAIDAARQKARAKTREHVLDAKIALKEYTAAVRNYSPAAANDPATIAKAAAASDRVRSLLDKGTKPETIITRAAEAGDVHTLDALRTEARWLDADKVPSGLTGVDGKAPPIDGLLQRIDAARLPLLSGDDAGVAEAAMSVDRLEAGVIAKLSRAESGIGSTGDLAGAVADRYAGLTSASGTDGLLEGGTGVATIQPGDGAGKVGSLGDAVDAHYAPAGDGGEAA